MKVIGQNGAAYLSCNPSLFARLRFPATQLQKDWSSHVMNSLVPLDSGRNKDLLFINQVNDSTQGAYACSISNQNLTIEHQTFYLIAAGKFLIIISRYAD